MAVVEPMPTASARMAMKAKPRDWASVRKERRRFESMCPSKTRVPGKGYGVFCTRITQALRFCAFCAFCGPPFPARTAALGPQKSPHGEVRASANLRTASVSVRTAGGLPGGVHENIARHVVDLDDLVEVGPRDGTAVVTKLDRLELDLRRVGERRILGHRETDFPAVVDFEVHAATAHAARPGRQRRRLYLGIGVHGPSRAHQRRPPRLPPLRAWKAPARRSGPKLRLPPPPGAELSFGRASLTVSARPSSSKPPILAIAAWAASAVS